MRISCQFCAAEYELDEARIPAEGLPVQCARCLGVFVVPAPGAASAPIQEMGSGDGLDHAGGYGASPQGATDGWNRSSSFDHPEPQASPATAGWESGGTPAPPQVSWEESAAAVAPAGAWGEAPPSGSASAWDPPPAAPSPAGGSWDQGGQAAGAWDAPSAAASWEGDNAWESSQAPAPVTPGAGHSPNALWSDRPPSMDSSLSRILDEVGSTTPRSGDLDDPTRISADPWGAPPLSPPAGMWDQGGDLMPAGRPPVNPRQGTMPGATPGAPGAGLDYFDLFGGEQSNVAAGPRVEDIKYAVRRTDGVVLGQYDQTTVRAYLQIGKITRADQASVDGGMSWQALETLSEFSDVTVIAPPPDGSPSGELARTDYLPLRGVATGDLARSSAAVPQAQGQMGIDARLAGAPQVGAGWDPLANTSGPSALAHRGTGDMMRGGDGDSRLATGENAGYLSEYDRSSQESELVSQGGALGPSGGSPSAAQVAPSMPSKIERPSWLAPAVNTAEGRASLDARRSARRRRIIISIALGVIGSGTLGFFLLWDPAFEDEGKIVAKLKLDDATIARYRAQSRASMQVGSYRAYTDARTKLLNVVRNDKDDRASKALYIQAMLYLVRDYGQIAIVKDIENYRRELSKVGESGVEFRKAKISYALWKNDYTDALRNLELLLAANPDDREARFLQGLALTTPKDGAAAVKVFEQLIAVDPKNAKYLRGKAEALLLTSRSAGIEVLRHIVSVAPTNPGATLRLAELYIDGGRREDGRRLLGWLADPRTPARKEASPDELARAQTFLGSMAFEDRDIDGARKYLEAALKGATSDTERVRALVVLGEVLVELRDYKGAIQRLELAQKSVPKSPEVLSHLGIAYARDGQSKQARDTVTAGRKALLERKIEELTPQQKTEHHLQDARLRVASAVVNENDEIPRLGEAVDDYRAALSLAALAKSDSANKLALEARVRLASLLRRQKNLAGALVELTEAQKLDGKSPQVHNGFGEVYQDQGQAAKAESSFRKAIELDARFTEARFNLATLLSDNGRMAEAVEILKAIEKADPGYPRLHLAMAIAYQRQKIYKEAIASFERAIKANPGDPRVFLRIGIAYFEFGGEDGFKKAREYLDKAIEKNRNLNQAYYYRGRVLMELAKPEIALDDYKTASEREPDNGIYRIYWGAAFEKMGSYRDSFFQYTRAIELLRDQKNEVDIALALYKRGRLRLERDEIPAALQDLDEALKYDPHNTEVLVLLGDSLAQTGRHAPAVERYRAALERGKKLRGLWFKLGKSLLETQKRPDAMKAMQNAAAEDPTDCYPHYYMGYLHKDAKQDAAAVRSLQRFLSLCAAPPEKKDVLRDIYDMEIRIGARKPQ